MRRSGRSWRRDGNVRPLPFPGRLDGALGNALLRIRDAIDTWGGYTDAMRTCLLVLVLSGCAVSGEDNVSSSTGEVKLPASLAASELGLQLDKPTIRGMQTWVDDPTFELKWASMLGGPIEFLGGASAAYHADLGGLAANRLPGDEVLCHGDPKIDNFGWTLVDGAPVFSDNDFDDAGFCPVAADALRYLLATNLTFNDPALDDAALQAYVDTVVDKHAATTIDPTTEPVWADVRTKGLNKATHGDRITLGGEVQPATVAEQNEVRALFAADYRFPRTVIDITRNVRSTGGSAGLRRFWVLAEDAGTRTIIELKQLGTPAVEFGRHTATLDGPDRLDTLVDFWWSTFSEYDHFQVTLLGSTFLVRDRFLRTNPKPAQLTPAQLTNMVAAEASVLALKHRRAWHKVRAAKLRAWLQASTSTLVTKWRGAYTAAGGH